MDDLARAALMVALAEAVREGAVGGDTTWQEASREAFDGHWSMGNTRYARERVEAGLAMPGVFEVGRRGTVRRAIEDTLLIVECSSPGEWEGHVRYLPL